MFKLIILCRFEALSKMPDSEMMLPDFDTEGQAELRAIRWLMYRPNDLVMLVPA